MKNRAKELLDHFMAHGGSTITTSASIGSYMRKHGLVKTTQGGGRQMDAIELTEVIHYCEKLKNEGLLFYFGNQTKEPFVGSNYLCVKYDQELAEYGGYEFLVQGFIYINEVFGKSVIPIEIINHRGEPDIGTGFVLEDDILVTAKHCIEGHKKIIIKMDEQPIIPACIGIHPDERIDVCIIKMDGNPFSSCHPLNLSEPQMLSEVLTIGYPPIPGFDAIPVSEVSTIGAEAKSAKGNIVGMGKSYLDGLDYFLLNSKVKSGNSGSPVIDKYGRLVGIVTNIPLDPTDRDKLDSLGYGVAVSSSLVQSLLFKMRYNREYGKIDFKVLDENTFSTHKA